MGFFRRWKVGIEQVTPLQQLVAKRNGIVGQVLGMLLAMVVIALNGLWYWLPFLFFSLVILIFDFVGTQKQVMKFMSFGGGILV